MPKLPRAVSDGLLTVTPPLASMPVDLDAAAASYKRPSAARCRRVSVAWRTCTLPAKIARSARSWTSIRSAATSIGALLSWPLSAETWLRCASAGEQRGNGGKAKSHGLPDMLII